VKYYQLPPRRFLSPARIVIRGSSFFDLTYDRSRGLSTFGQRRLVRGRLFSISRANRQWKRINGERERARARARAEREGRDSGNARAPRVFAPRERHFSEAQGKMPTSLVVARDLSPLEKNREIRERRDPERAARAVRRAVT